MVKSELFLPLGGTLFRKTPEEERDLAKLVARRSINSTQTELDLFKEVMLQTPTT